MIRVVHPRSWSSFFYLYLNFESSSTFKRFIDKRFNHLKICSQKRCQSLCHLTVSCWSIVIHFFYVTLVLLVFLLLLSPSLLLSSCCCWQCCGSWMFIPDPNFSSVADPDPGSGAFLTPGSGIRNRFFSGSATLVAWICFLFTTTLIRTALDCWTKNLWKYLKKDNILFHISQFICVMCHFEPHDLVQD